MKIIDPSVEVVKISDPLKKVEYVARVCTDSYGKMTEDSAKPFCEKLLKMGHLSPFEHFRGEGNIGYMVDNLIAGKAKDFSQVYGLTYRYKEHKKEMLANINGRDFIAIGGDLEHFAEMKEASDYITLKFTVDIGISRELIRHRQMSFMEQSTRYVNMKDGIDFVRPLPFEWVKDDSILDDDGNLTKGGALFYFWNDLNCAAERCYKFMIQQCCTPQEARSVLPLSTKTVLFMTGMFHQWDDVFALRLAKGAHPSMRYIMEKAKVLVDQERKSVGEELY